MDLIIREFEKHSVRMINENGKVLFVAADVCNVLGIKNTSKAVISLDDDEKGITKSNTLGGEQEVITITESGLYALVMRSNKPQAKKFRKWVTSDVLPSIRQNGAYVAPNATTDGIISAIEKSFEEKFKLAQALAKAEAHIEVLNMFKPIGQPGEISKKTGAEKWRFRRGFFCSGDKGRPASLLLQHPLQPDMFETFELR